MTEETTPNPDQAPAGSDTTDPSALETSAETPVAMVIEETTPTPEKVPATSDDPASITLKNSPETIAAERAVVALMTGVKNFGVFPPEHASTINMLQGVLRAINEFGENFGSLSFDVEKQSLIFQEKEVYEGPASDDNPAYVLNRAGISRFELAPGLEVAELINFFQIYNHFREVADEPDDDLVSALWRASLPHIFYDASYDLWSESETAIDYDTLQALDSGDQSGAEVTARPGGKSWEKFRLDSAGENYRKVSLALLANINDYCKLSQDEQKTLSAMIVEDTQESDSETVVRLMLILLIRENDSSAHLAVLGFLQEIFLNFLAELSFQRAFFVFSKIREEDMATRESKPWATPAYKKFYEAVERPEIIESLVGAWPRFAELGAQKVKALAAILQQLPVEVATQLIEQLPEVEDGEAQGMFVSIIVLHVRHDQSIIEAGLASDVEVLVLEMIAIIKELNDRDLVDKYLVNFRYDSRTAIRRETMDILASHNIY